ncbi:MAG TPA: hypothetical protein ENK26_15375 [Gammaproteobacteria bacterium]|nr:hypothetical protein [Gammaproteobacteria bacterium]
MTDRHFRLRLHCNYHGEQNEPDDLTVEVWASEQWQPLQLDVSTPGFLMFVYTMLTCQHMYLRANAAERNLVLANAEGAIHVIANSEWELLSIEVDFDVTLQSGEPSTDDKEYIISRMLVCPVSKNLREGVEKRTKVRFS